MQTAKARNGSFDVPQKMSPGTRPSRLAQATGSDTDSTSSGHPVIKRPVIRSPKSQERKSPRSPVTEREGKISELESQLGKLREDLKKAKEQLGSSESWKARAQQEAEESKKLIAAMAAKLEDSQKQLVEFSESEHERLQELRKISQERDRAWESELEALQMQHSADSAALSSALNDIQRLKLQLEAATDSKASFARQAEFARAELQTLKEDMAETIIFIDNLKMQLEDCKESENTAHAKAEETLTQLEIAKTTITKLQSDRDEALESFHSASEELKETKDRISEMEEERDELDCADLSKSSGHYEEQDELLGEIKSLKSEIERLKSCLEAAEAKNQNERSLASLEIQSAYEFADRTRSQSSHRLAQLQAELKKANEDVVELKANLMDNETELQGIKDENENLHLELNSTHNQLRKDLETEISKLNSNVTDLKANMMDKETELQNILEENETLKARLVENCDGDVDLAKAAEKEALVKLNYASEEVEKSSRKAARMTEQLEAALTVNAEMESELRRLRVQSDQWRKAAEAAASVLSETTNNGKMMERSGSMDGMDYGHPTAEKMMSPYLDDVDDETHMKKNGNVLKKFNLWKKVQK